MLRTAIGNEVRVDVDPGSLDQGTRDVFDRENSKRAAKTCPTDLWSVTRRKLDQLNPAEAFEDLKMPPGNQLEAPWRLHRPRGGRRRRLGRLLRARRARLAPRPPTRHPRSRRLVVAQPAPLIATFYVRCSAPYALDSPGQEVIPKKSLAAYPADCHPSGVTKCQPSGLPLTPSEGSVRSWPDASRKRRAAAVPRNRRAGTNTTMAQAKAGIWEMGVMPSSTSRAE